MGEAQADRVAGPNASGGAMWDIARIRGHLAEQLPLVSLMGMEVVAADQMVARLRLTGGPANRRPGGSVAGPVLFAMADVAAYVLNVMLRQDTASLTSSLTIQFLRPAFDVPIIAEATVLRAGRTLQTFDVRLWAEADGPERLVAQATATLATAAIGRRV